MSAASRSRSAGINSLCRGPTAPATLRAQQFLNLFPLPQGHGSFLPGFNSESLTEQVSVIAHRELSMNSARGAVKKAPLRRSRRCELIVCPPRLSRSRGDHLNTPAGDTPQIPNASYGYLFRTPFLAHIW